MLWGVVVALDDSPVMRRSLEPLFVEDPLAVRSFKVAVVPPWPLSRFYWKAVVNCPGVKN